MNRFKKKKEVFTPAAGTGGGPQPSNRKDSRSKGKRIFSSLKSKLTALFILIALLPVGVLSYLNYQSSRAAYETLSQQAFQFGALQVVSELNPVLAEIRSTDLGGSEEAAWNSIQELVEKYNGTGFSDNYAVSSAEIGSSVDIEGRLDRIVQNPLEAQKQRMGLLSVIFLLGSTGLAVLLAENLTKPIRQLTRAAERVSSGDLWIRAVEGRDEIGALGTAFNNMTSQLRRTLDGLEQGVAERTAELAKTSRQAMNRAEQLETIAELARTIASIQEHDKLLERVSQLISERFGYYHIGIFLVDRQREYAVLQAVNSEGGQRMLSRSHSLRIDSQDIVAQVISSAEPRSVLDVGEDAATFDNPDLPYTRSEMVLPLIVGDQVVGALDVQAMEQGAFKPEDLTLLSTLADQVVRGCTPINLRIRDDAPPVPARILEHGGSRKKKTWLRVQLR
jgi:nitrate/nitrite-specific signal transduction histidine kinase